MTKANNFMKSRKFLGMCVRCLSYIGYNMALMLFAVPVSSLDLRRRDPWRKTHGESSEARMSYSLTITTLSNIWKSIGVQNVMAEMERIQARGEVPEEELKALEMDMTGKVNHFLFVEVCWENL